MIIAFASGKGGAGKTTISLNLALSLPEADYFDLDVEEPDGHIFLNPVIDREEEVTISVPSIDEELCTACGECARSCAFNALVSLKTKPLFFPGLCHGCGLCTYVCPEKAIHEVPRSLGVLRHGRADGHGFVEGLLNLKEPMAVPIIRKAKVYAEKSPLAILDAPPGASCPMVAAVTDADYVVLVAESTPFGLNDMKIAVNTLKVLQLPFGVVLNREGLGDDRVEAYCREEGIPLLMKFPEDRGVAEAYSRGEVAINWNPALISQFKTLFSRIEAEVAKKGAANG